MADNHHAKIWEESLHCHGGMSSSMSLWNGLCWSLLLFQIFMRNMRNHLLFSVKLIFHRLLELHDGLWPLILNFCNCSKVLSSWWLPTPWIILRVLTSLSEHFKPLKDVHTRQCFISMNTPSILFVSVAVLLSLKTVLKFYVAAVWQQENAT